MRQVISQTEAYTYRSEVASWARDRDGELIRDPDQHAALESQWQQDEDDRVNTRLCAARDAFAQMRNRAEQQAALDWLKATNGLN